MFFPLYPLLIRALAFDLTYINLSALIVANVASLIGFLYLYKLTKLEFNEKVAVKAVLFLSVFPIAYFFSVPYTEGLFFALAISSIYYARLGKWPLAGLLGFLCSLTRLTGLLLLPALLIEYFHQTRWCPKATRRDIVFVFSALAGFLIYLGINQVVTGNALTFIAVENTQWHNTLDPWLGLNKAWFWVWDKPLLDTLTIGIAPIAFAFFGLVMIGVALWKRMRPVYVAFMFLAWSLAISTSWWISVPRYIMAMFPMFMLMGTLTDRRAVNAVIVVFSVTWLCVLTVFFALGWWAF